MMTERSKPRNQVYLCGILLKRKAFPCCFINFDGGRVVSLNDDVLMEILVRLPVKSVIRFKLVCKSWLSLMLTDQFRRLHTLCRHKPPPTLFFTTVRYAPVFKRELFYTNPIIKRSAKVPRMIPFDTNAINDCEILSCSNGLMLLQCRYYNDYYVYNPVSTESKKLSLTRDDMFNSVESLQLVFDPSVSPYYKIVCVRAKSEFLSPHLIEVFDSESGAWRVCVEPFTTSPSRENYEIMKFRACVQHKSLIYFIRRNPQLFSRVYCFDIVKNVSQLRCFPIPQRAKAAAYSHTLQESNGRVYYCALLEDSPGESSAALWELKVNEDDPRHPKWLLKYDHRVRRLPGLPKNKVLTFITETSTVLIHVVGRIVGYNFLDKSYKELLNLGIEIYSVNVHHFGETLAPL